MKKRVGFLYIDFIHHIYHSASIGFQLSKIAPEYEIDFLVSTKAGMQLLQDLSKLFPEHKCNFLYLDRPFYQHDIILNFRQRPFPRKSTILNRHKTILYTYDAFVSTDFYTVRMKDKIANDHAKLFFAFHGAGDGEYGYKKEVGEYDYLLLSGNKTKQRCEQLGYLKENNWRIIGYPKFDFYRDNSEKKRNLFPEQRPIVLYNPHFRELSSWHEWGNDILEYFYQSDKFNLIFAPHIMLFAKFSKNPDLAKYAEATNILVDLGDSIQGIDMTYSSTADIYLGDVSSQVYEFIYKPKPCIFLNPNRIVWRGNPSFYFWNMGPVIEDFKNFAPVFDSLRPELNEYEAVQENLRQETFNMNSTPSGLRGAQAIKDYLT